MTYILQNQHKNSIILQNINFFIFFTIKFLIFIDFTPYFIVEYGIIIYKPNLSRLSLFSAPEDLV